MASRRAGELPFNIVQVVEAVSDMVDLVDPRLAEHHRRTALVALHLAEALGIAPQTRRELGIAALLHDAGAFRLRDRLPLLDFETQQVKGHTSAGALLFAGCAPLAHLAPWVLTHHRRWASGEGRDEPLENWILPLADRVAVGAPLGVVEPGAVRAVQRRVLAERGKMFRPEVVDAFRSFSAHEAFWFDLAAPHMEIPLAEKLRGLPPRALSLEGLRQLGFLSCALIDYRSRFTATHSRGVTACARLLAQTAGFSGPMVDALEVAGLFHDIGKLAVPEAVLEKPGRLSEDQWWIMMQHPYYTRRMLSRIDGAGDIVEYAANHHEHRGAGCYPFHYNPEGLAAGARVVAVADVFTALTEDRPYRAGMTPEEARRQLKGMVRQHRLDPELTAAVLRDFEPFDAVRRQEQAAARAQYEMLIAEAEES